MTRQYLNKRIQEVRMNRMIGILRAKICNDKELYNQIMDFYKEATSPRLERTIGENTRTIDAKTIFSSNLINYKGERK